MISKLELDPRIDPRIKAAFAGIDLGTVRPNVSSREGLLAQEYSPAALTAQDRTNALFDAMDNEDVAPSTGLTVRTESLTSSPDGNTINIQYIRPDGDETLPCVYYIHGGRMQFSSCYLGNLQDVGPDDRLPRRGRRHGRLPQLRAPVLGAGSGALSAGLNDCMSGLKWVHTQADSLGIDPSRIVVAGESGGGNLTLALGMKLKQDREVNLIAGLYAMCPFIAGEWPLPQNPSSTENEGIFIFVQENRSAMAYGIDAFTRRNPLAWPGMATPDDVRGLPPVVISVNECDPLRDEGIGFYRLLLNSGVTARCRQVMGTVHGTEILPVICPDISRSTAADIADFAKGAS